MALTFCRRQARRAAWLVCWGIATGTAAPLPPAVVPAESAGAIARARELLQKDAAKVPGFAVAVEVCGQLAWSEGFGLADLETRRPVTATTRFRIGSVSKALTAAGLVLLAERGQIDLDAPVQKYVPDFPVKSGVITTRLLAGHLGGIRHYRGAETRLNQPFPTIRAGLKIFEDDPLVAAPGEKFSYSTYGWSLISAVMESAAQEDFLEFMAAEVWRPLGLDHTRPDRAGAVDPERTRFYETNARGEWVAAPTVDVSYKWAGGGFLSTAEDLAHFGSALLAPGFLREDSRRLLFTPQKTSDGKPTHYGIGWFVVTDKRGRTVYYHDGGQQGSSAVLLIRPEASIVTAIVCNLTAAAIINQAPAIADAFAPAAAGPAEPR